MWKIILKLLHLFDNGKNRSYVSEPDAFLYEFDNKNPTKSESQKKEILKHRNIHRREKKAEVSFLDG